MTSMYRKWAVRRRTRVNHPRGIYCRCRALPDSGPRAHLCCHRWRNPGSKRGAALHRLILTSRRRLLSPPTEAAHIDGEIRKFSSFCNLLEDYIDRLAFLTIPPAFAITSDTCRHFFFSIPSAYYQWHVYSDTLSAWPNRALMLKMLCCLRRWQITTVQ